ncbi:MAG TPA: penicillin-binding protein activator, partial [Xanthomonadales bacterium]|nr:penicillin-binding protein activator [Xanthomonadales bacterium]
MSTKNSHDSNGQTPLASALRHRWALLVWAAAISMAIASCATAPPPPQAPVQAAANPQQAFDRGNYAQAAREWQSQAVSAPEDEADTLRISAADAWLLADEPDRAETLLRWINKDELDPQQRARLELVQAELAYRSGYYLDAAKLLQTAQADLPASSKRRFESLQLQVAAALEIESSVDLSQVQQLADRMSEYNPAQALALLKALEPVPSGELAAMLDRPRADPDLDPWLDLALVIRQNLVVADELEPSVNAWKSRHRDHYLAETDALDLWLLYRQGFQGPGKVAVLLPQSGRLHAAAQALRDGMVSAFLDNPGHSQLLFVDSGTETDSIPGAYFEARDMGADYIIGPLQTEAIEALLQLSDLRTPVLALNDVPAGIAAPIGLAKQINGVSLSQDAEVRAIASAMADMGYARAMVLAPESEWGERVVTVFSEEFLQDQRQIVVSGRFMEYENDHSAVLERLLQLDQSRARKQQLENTLQLQLDYEPVRRDDVDVIFLAANTTQGRLIRPQLRFHNAGDIPVFASARIYSGQPDKTRDQDLNGIIFPSSALQIRFASMRNKPQTASLK